MTDSPAPSPWPGSCPLCGSPVMPVQKRVLAGGSRLWMLVSGIFVAAALTAALMLDSHYWPLDMMFLAVGALIGFMRVRRWQCRRCRAMYRRCPERKATKPAGHSVLRQASGG